VQSVKNSIINNQQISELKVKGLLPQYPSILLFQESEIQFSNHQISLEISDNIELGPENPG